MSTSGAFPSGMGSSITRSFYLVVLNSPAFHVLFVAWDQKIPKVQLNIVPFWSLNNRGRAARLSPGGEPVAPCDACCSAWPTAVGDGVFCFFWDDVN